MQRQPGLDHFADQPHAFNGHKNIEGPHQPRSFFSTFAPPPDVAHGRTHDQPRRRPSSPKAPTRQARHAQRFSFLSPRSILRSKAASSSYAARTARARPISSKPCRCLLPGAGCAGRSFRNAPGSAAPAALRSRSKSRRTARPISLAPAGSRAPTARRRSGSIASTARPSPPRAHFATTCGSSG